MSSIYIEHLHNGSDCIYCCAVTVTIRELIVNSWTILTVWLEAILLVIVI